MVDAVSSLGGVELAVDAWGVDVAVAGSQKALMCPPGLAFASVSARAWERAARSTLPRYYLDWRLTADSQAKNDTAFTPAVTIVAALRKALELIESRGSEAIWAHNRRLALAAREGVKALGLRLYSPDDDTAAMVTAFLMPDGIDGQRCYGVLRDRHGIVLAGGQGPLRGRIMRIGHMGYMNEFDIVTALAGLELALGGARLPAADAGSRRRPRRRGVRVRMTSVLVTEEIAAAGVELLRGQFQVDVELNPPPEQLAERIGAYDALIVRSATSVSAGLLEHAGKLKVIGRAGTGVDNVDVAAATRRGIIVANAPGSNMVAAAEHALGLLLAIARNIPQAHAALTAGPLGAQALRRRRAGRQGARRRRLRPHRPAGRRPRPRVRDARRGVRPVRVGRALPRAAGVLGVAREPAAAGRLRHAARAADRRDQAPDRRRAARADEARARGS